MEALSTLDWWQSAGVDTLVEEEPRDWLAPPAPVVAPVRAAVGAHALPPTLAAMHAFLASDPEFGEGVRLSPKGDVAGGLMLLIDMPEAPDGAAGKLLSGEIGLLFDRMLAAIGRDRASTYVSVISPARPAGGKLTPALARAHAGHALHHIALAGPRVLLLMGDGASRAILGASVAEARGRLHHVNQGGANVTAIATFHPRFLFQQPARKAAAWCDLRMVSGELAG